jgi:hypothetical protein
MSAGLAKYVVVNLDDLEKAFEAGAEVTVEAVAEKGLLNISGRDAKLGLKVGRPAAGPCLGWLQLSAGWAQPSGGLMQPCQSRLLLAAGRPCSGWPRWF